MSVARQHGWVKAAPRKPGLYWVRRKVPTERWIESISAGYRPLLASHEIVGVVVVSIGPKGGARPMRWCEPIRRQANPQEDWEYRGAGRPWLDDGVFASDERLERHSVSTCEEPAP